MKRQDREHRENRVTVQPEAELLQDGQEASLTGLLLSSWKFWK